MFTKATGFATFVGTESGGDGIGVDPIPVGPAEQRTYCKMPVLYTEYFGDGSGTPRISGTEPDIISPDGEDAFNYMPKIIISIETAVIYPLF